MHDHHTLADEKTVERPTDAGMPARPQLEEPFAKRPRVGQAKTRAVLGQEFNQTSVIRKDVNRPGFDLGKDARVEILDLVAHGRMLANTRTRGNVTLLKKSQLRWYATQYVEPGPFGPFFLVCLEVAFRPQKHQAGRCSGSWR